MYSSFYTFSLLFSSTEEKVIKLLFKEYTCNSTSYKEPCSQALRPETNKSLKTPVNQYNSPREH